MPHIYTPSALRTGRRRDVPRTWLAPLGFGLLMAYFSYHLFQSERSIFAWQALSKALRESEKNLALRRQARHDLEHQVQLLRPGHLSLDMLDQQVRAVLGYSHPDDLVMPLSESITTSLPSSPHLGGPRTSKAKKEYRFNLPPSL